MVDLKEFENHVRCGYVCCEWSIGKNTKKGKRLRDIAERYIAEQLGIDPSCLKWVKDDINHMHLFVGEEHVSHIDENDMNNKLYLFTGLLDGLGHC